MSSLGSADTAASLEAEPDGDRPSRCRKSIGIGQIRNYLFRVKAGGQTEDDVPLGEHIAACEACQEIVEDLYCFEDALRLDYRQLAPLLAADVLGGDRDEVPIELHDVEIGELQEQLTSKIVSVIEFAQRIDKLDREYEQAFRSQKGRRLFQASCKAELKRIDPDLSSVVQESMIDMWRTRPPGRGTKQRLCDIPAAKQHPFEFLLGISSSKSVVDAKQRLWYRVPDPDPNDPLPYVVETDTNVLVATA